MNGGWLWGLNWALAGGEQQDSCSLAQKEIENSWFSQDDWSDGEAESNLAGDHKKRKNVGKLCFIEKKRGRVWWSLVQFQKA